MKILLVEDNNDLALNISEFLEGTGHIIDYSDNGRSALELAVGQQYDVIILDVMLPGLNGLDFCEQLRTSDNSDIPVIMLTARDTEQDKLLGFGVGADDYLVKPFSLPELEARLQALVRRSTPGYFQKQLSFEDLVYYPETMKLMRGDTVLSLKPIPLKILLVLLRSPNQVVTREKIEHLVWSDDVPDSEVLRTHIYVIRNELCRNGGDNILHTIRGTGYMLGDSDHES